MYLKVAPNGQIFQRAEISGWYKVPTAHNAVLLYTDAAMLLDGSIVAIATNGQLQLLATPTGPAADLQFAPPAAPHSVAVLFDGSVLVLTAAGTLFRARSPWGPWNPVPLPGGGGVVVDLAVDTDGHVVLLDNAGVPHRANARGAPAPGAAWGAVAGPALANIVRIEFLRDGSRLGIDNANHAHLLPAGAPAWQVLQDFGNVQAVTQLGGHTLLAIDPADHRLMTADALPENWVQVAWPPGGPAVVAIEHVRDQIIAYCNNNTFYAAPYTRPPGGAPVIGVFAPAVQFSAPPVPLISLTTHQSGRPMGVGNDHHLYVWMLRQAGNLPGQPVVPPGQPGVWVQVNTGATQLSSVMFLEDGFTMHGVDHTGLVRLVCRPDNTSRYDQTAPWVPIPAAPGLIAAPGPITRVVRIRDGAFLEVVGNALYRRPTLRDAPVRCGWAGTCVQVIELATDPADVAPRAAKWLLGYSASTEPGLAGQGGLLGNGRPWGDGTQMAARAGQDRNPWDAGSRVTPLIGGFAALSAMRDAFEAAIAEAAASPNAPGNRGYVYIADWLLTPLRDLSEDNVWSGAAWVPGQQAVRDQTAIGLIARMMAAGIRVRVIAWMPTSTQAQFAVAGHARQHWHLARLVQELNLQLRAQGGPWNTFEPGIVALDLRTPDVTAVSVHQKMCVVRVGEVNVGFCGGVDLAFTRRDFRRPADGITGAGDWQSGNQMPAISQNWPHQNPAPPFNYPPMVPAHGEDVIEDELALNVYGQARRWHDQHLKLEGPVVTSLEEQFDERWRVPGRPYHFAQGDHYGNDNQVQFTSASAFAGTTINPLPTSPCPPVGNAVVQLWRTIPVDKRRKAQTPFGRGEFTVMAGVSNAVQKATQLITIWDQYFWSVPLSKLLVQRIKQVPTLKVLIVLPPHGSSSPANEMWYRSRALQVLWNGLTAPEQARVRVFNLWDTPHNVGVYVHAKVQTYDDGLLVCGSANMNRRSFTLDMELDCAVMHKPDVAYHLANLALMLTGQPFTNFAPGWLNLYWAQMTIANAAQTAISDPFFCDAANIRQNTPNNIPYDPGGKIPESSFEPTSVNGNLETVGSNTPGSPNAPGRLDQLVWLLERHADNGNFPFRYPADWF